MAAPYKWLDDFVLQGWLGRLSPSAIKVVFALSAHMTRKNSEAWPSADRLGQLTSLSRATVFSALGELRDAGLIASNTRLRPGRFRSYEITVHQLLPVPPGPAEYKSKPQDRTADHQSKPEDSTPSVQSNSADTEHGKEVQVLEFGHVQGSSRKRDVAETGNGEQQSRKLDPTQLRARVSEWMQTHPGGEPLDCAKALQHQGLWVFPKDVLEVLREAAGG